ncbi:glycosyltransferase family 4 protein [Paenibacillus caseinilyticus]|uniref:Glycosyl transferase family 1 n=1 Tax=Paenibacillus mucilaginosus K02 TaxID=997761 RepID=I0BSF4_9BACL|nr:glycosyltransferase family 4 protein [Paenibacillus mucilaginosus]AFH65301.1 glycosyl transferase family 1 [Paenibacillus mucilaginosus K02]AFK65452.1 glycosyltransferase group 1 family protein [Paenibacillus mucilaginosus K02]
MKKKIVFVINYFYPDFASTGQLMTSLCLHLQDKFDITVIAAQPGYAGQKSEVAERFATDYLENIRIVRIKLPVLDKSSKWSRLRYITSYFFLATWAMLMEKKTDIVYTISSPPILGGLIGTIGKVLKRTKHVYNIQDFNPEQAEAVSFTKMKWMYSLARGLDNLNCKLADHIITVGRDMQETLAKRFGYRGVPDNSVINNWTEENEIVPLTKDHPQVRAFLEENGLTDRFIVMYSGNLGLYYDLENIITVTKHFADDERVAFVFIGEGAVKGRMQQFVKEQGLKNVLFLPYQPKDYIRYSLNAADVHLVVNQKGIKGVSVPSKIYGVMASGKPILGVLENGSEAHRLIMESESGYVVEPQDYRGITACIEAMAATDSAELRRMGLNGRTYLESYLKKEQSIEKYSLLLESI